MQNYFQKDSNSKFRNYFQKDSSSEIIFRKIDNNIRFRNGVYEIKDEEIGQILTSKNAKNKICGCSGCRLCMFI